MSHFVQGTRLSYPEYQQAESFVSDIQSGQRAIEHAVSRQTREIVASQEELHAQGMQVLSSGFGQMSEGMETIACRLEGIQNAIGDLDATLRWGFTEMLAGVGRLNDSVEKLISIARTPVETWAYNQYRIALDATRRQLYPEALEALNRAIGGYGDNPGYKLEYRFHYLKGRILCGAVENHDEQLADYPAAEASFLTAARYARADHKKEGAQAFLAAGWTAQRQGIMEAALDHARDALTLQPDLGEALFLVAKIHMCRGDVTIAFPFLKKAITLDRNFSLKAIADGDFQKHSEELNSFLDECRREALEPARDAIAIAKREVACMTEWHAVETSKEEHDAAITNLQLALDSLDHRTFFGNLDARVLAEVAKARAQRATHVQQSTLRRLRDQLLNEVAERVEAFQYRAKNHAPSTWAETEEQIVQLRAMPTEPGQYQEWVAVIRQASTTRGLIAKTVLVTQQREDACVRVSDYNASLQEAAREDSLKLAIATFVLVLIGLDIYYIVTADSARWFMVLFGWFFAAIGALPVALVVWLLAYIIIKAGAGRKRLPPKN
jgi:tetratricopeptide (TPR) repeat protein